MEFDMPSFDNDVLPSETAGKFAIEVADETFQFRTLSFHDPEVTAAQIAECFGAHPLSQFRILQQLTTGEVETKRPTETTDLRERGRERFFVVRSDRDFAFTVDGLSLAWPLATIVGEHMRILARAKESEDLVRVTPHGFEPVEAEDILSLAGSEVEEFRLVPLPQTVTVFYREQPFELERRRWTTEELMQRFAVPAGYKLDRIKADGEFKELKPGQQIKLRDGMEFTSHVPAGQSS
ncbi:multiubiquitin domain-containing protein [Sphingobium herbicidovorans]|nr:multiubiquitin domain-containing protein [Sphingobium herbicidovorans]